MDTKSNETPRIVQPRLLQREQKLWKAAIFENDVLDKHGIIQEKQGHVQKLVMSSKYSQLKARKQLLLFITVH